MLRVMRRNNISLRSAPVATLCALAFVVVSSGCALNGTSGPELTSNDKIVEGSVVAATRSEGVTPTDAEVIKTAVAGATDDGEVKALAWANPETGSSGTIVAIDEFMGKHGQSCRGFKTSVDTFMGIAFYNGEACQISPGEWVLSWFKPTE